MQKFIQLLDCKKIQMLRAGISFLLLFLVSACLRTRSEVSEQDQNAVYGKKNAQNQIESQTAIVPNIVVDEKDELIRNLNGRVEVLENQLATLINEKQTINSRDMQKVALLQEAVTKMEIQIQKLEAELPVNPVANKLTDKDARVSSDSEAATRDKKGKKLDKKNDSYEIAQQYFDKQEWKKAIINFQKYTDELPRGKNVADAKFKIGVCFQELGMREEAMAFYEEVVANYAKTTAGKQAKTRLGNLKK